MACWTSSDTLKNRDLVDCERAVMYALYARDTPIDLDWRRSHSQRKRDILGKTQVDSISTQHANQLLDHIFRVLENGIWKRLWLSILEKKEC